MDVATWSLPKGAAADKSLLVVERMRHYRFQQKHMLKDGTHVIPNLDTIKHILQAYDMLEMRVAIESNSYHVCSVT